MENTPLISLFMIAYLEIEKSEKVWFSLNFQVNLFIFVWLKDRHDPPCAAVKIPPWLAAPSCCTGKSASLHPSRSLRGTLGLEVTCLVMGLNFYIL